MAGRVGSEVPRNPETCARVTALVERPRPLLVAFALALCLVAGSPPRIVGDGGEYLAMALSLAAFRGPALASSDIPRIQQIIGQADSTLGGWDPREAGVSGPDGRRDFFHFWFYPLLAVPSLWITQALGVTPIAAFTTLNLCLLGLALWVAFPRLGGATCLLLFAGPIVWWLDKPHTEAFTFALLSLAFLLMRERPWWSMLAAGAAATQNPPIGLLVGLVFAGHVLARRDILRDRRFMVGAVGGLALAALQPAYTYLRHGTPSLLLIANPSRIPSVPEMLAVPFDPSIGLIANFPMFVLVAGLAAGLVLTRKPRELLSMDTIIATVAGGAFLFSFGQATNVHHGGTPSMSRYAVWLIPLGIPFLRRSAAVGGATWRRFTWAAAVLSASVCVFVFHPAVPQYSREPTLLANFLWTKHPGWNNPLPEIFVETLVRTEEHSLPVATSNCEKVLLIGRDNGGAWPIPCFPQPLPPECSPAGSMCYANRDVAHYQFATPPGGQVVRQGYMYQPDWVWPAQAEPHVRALLGQWEWWNLKPKTQGDDVLRYVRDVHVLELEGLTRVVFVLRHPGADADIGLRLPRPTAGSLIDAMTGQTVSEVHFDGPPFERWDVKLPSEFPLLLLSFSTSGS